MKVLILSYSGSIHTKRWVKALSERGCEICLFSLNTSDDTFYLGLDKVEVVNYQYRYTSNSFKDTILQRFEFFHVKRIVRKIIDDFHPDIVHAHYAVDYGSIGAVVGFHPFILSVWGSDVYGDPFLPWFSKLTLRYKLHKADCIMSTSAVMAKETAKYTKKKIVVTPFGVDTKHFCPLPVFVPSDSFVVGNVKTLAPKYGIDILIRAFARVVENNPSVLLLLKIAGKGPQEEELKQLAKDLGIEDKVDFVGYIQNEKLVEFYNSISVAVSLSVFDSESFGVVAVEAMSCECPVVVSDADGFTEVVEDNITGFVVPKRDAEATATAIQKFIDDPDLRKKMGAAGRKRVQRMFEWNENVKAMLGFYKELIDNK